VMSRCDVLFKRVDYVISSMISLITEISQSLIEV
jgi:hypothetical protein